MTCEQDACFNSDGGYVMSGEGRRPRKEEGLDWIRTLHLSVRVLKMEENKKSLMETLLRGRNSAKTLQSLLLENVKDEGSVSVDDLVMELLGSFYTCLSMVNTCNSNKISRVSTCSRMGNLARIANWPLKVYNGSKPAPVVKKGRGCYKRRSMASGTTVSDTIEDGYGWRKYGQKSVLNFKFPRCYYRCTHKFDHGCKASKQVQKLEDEESNVFHITYFGHHTCPTTPPQTFSHHGPVINFKDFKNHQYSSISIPATAINIHFDPSFEQKDDINMFDNVTSTNLFAAFGSKDTSGYDMNACHEFASFMGFNHGGSYASKSSWDNLFENNDFLNDIPLDDTMFSELI
ncbi:probable WRKY transcription factor 70 [Cynara cardunculus var. scolymus]|uniref:probable WRKY transcription factor 70 n=1 Tax=Cynara cardunculus var. scolymus TaxID=59895 RepID=UPI000D6300F7|nr:probable WRKY transcription factor 70 [Cynara cardunculus var. scolymus]